MYSMIDMNTNNKIVVIAGPSGAGKNSVLEGVLRNCNECARLVTATTRKPRDGETDGVDYHFISKNDFLSGIENGDIPEYWHAKDTDRYYGTYLPDLREKFRQGKVVIAQVQAEGIRYFKDNFHTIAICITPDSPKELMHRIKSRHPMTEQELSERMALIEKEMREFQEVCDYTVRNPDGKLDMTIEKVIEILQNEGFVT